MKTGACTSEKNLGDAVPKQAPTSPCAAAPGAISARSLISTARLRVRGPYKRQHASQLAWVLQLKPEQLAELKAWLADDKVTYLIATQRLQERFNFKISKSALCRWYVRQLPPPAAPVTFVTLLDVIVEVHGTPLRIQVNTPLTEDQS